MEHLSTENLSGHQGNWLETSTWLDIDKYLRRDNRLIVVFGSVEQHGQHLPIETDTIIAREIANKVSESTGVLVTQPLSLGNSAYHRAFPGTISLSALLHARVVTEILIELLRTGFSRLFLLTSHGGNVP